MSARPAVNYLNSYSGYVEAVAQWWQRKAGLDWVKLRNQALTILKEDARLMNIVKLIGEDALPDDQKVVFHGAQLIKENFLQQSAFDPIDTYSPAEKQVVMLQIIMKFIERMQDTVVAHRIPVYRIMELPILEELGRMKYRYKGDDLEPFKKILNRLEEQFDDLFKRET